MDKLPTLKVVYDRKKEASETKPALIYFEISYNRVRKYISTGISIYPHQWAKDSCTIRKHDNAIRLNSFLEIYRRKIMDEMLESCKHPLGFDISHFTESVKQEKKSVQLSFIDFCYERLSLRGLRQGTIKQHLVAIRSMEDSGIIKNFRDLTPEKIARWNDYLTSSELIKSQQTIASYHRRIASYINEAITYGYITENPYRRYKVDRGRSAKVKYLTREDLDKIMNAEIGDAVLQRIRDLFVFQAHTGLSYADLYTTDYKSAEMRNGRYYIRDSRIKTGEEYYLVLLAPALRVIEKYGWELPKYSNQKYNDYLKALGLACGITKPITSHMARHTFATTITLSNNVPIQIVAKMLGHSDIKTTQRYAKVLAEDVAQAYADLDDKI